ncbi:MAG: AgmX/PglI C-terminal domain-containing protein [Deltaproteobacteria bacterium]|nr:AgmX/PglI C-terminal domain-containing protein [Deltaproteobacteria bacterium]
MFVVGMGACAAPLSRPKTAADDAPAVSSAPDSQKEATDDANESHSETVSTDIGPDMLAPESTGSVVIEEAIVSSAEVSRDAAREAVEHTMHQLRLCYDQVLQRRPNAAGSILARVRVDESAEVTSVDVVTSDFRGGILDECVQSSFYSLEILPATITAPVDIEYRIQFAP